MDRIIYTTMTGANAAAHRQSVLANNLANASTNGFRAEMSTFRSVPMQGDGSTTRVFALEATSGYLNTAGPAKTTGRSLDAMAMGNAWFAVQGLDGLEAYTRAGSFNVSAAGQLVTPSGLPVLSDGGAPIDIPQGAEVTLGADGTITAKAAGQPPAAVGRLKLASPRRKTRSSVATTGCFAPPRVSPCPTMQQRACSAVRSKAQREPGGEHGGHDRRLAPVRTTDAASANGRNQRQISRPAAQPQRLTAGLTPTLNRLQENAMFTALYTAKSGMTVQQTNIDLHSHNLSNVSTTGFKRNFANVEDLAYQNYRQVGAAATEQNQLPTGLHMGLGARTVSIGLQLRAGQPAGVQEQPGRGHQRQRLL